jgi:hypothetical protein
MHPIVCATTPTATVVMITIGLAKSEVKLPFDHVVCLGLSPELCMHAELLCYFTYKLSSRLVKLMSSLADVFQTLCCKLVHKSAQSNCTCWKYSRQHSPTESISFRSSPGGTSLKHTSAFTPFNPNCATCCAQCNVNSRWKSASLQCQNRYFN